MLAGHLARNPGTAQTVAQAMWEGTQSPKPIGPLGRALLEFIRLGWCNMRGWWQWSLPHSATVVHLVHAPKEYVEHLFREALRENQLTALEKRRPRTFGGMGARLDRMLTLSDIAACDTELDKSLLRGVMVGAIWTADRAHRRGLRPDGDCPYCPREVREDEDHLLWRCTAWKKVRDPLEGNHAFGTSPQTGAVVRMAAVSATVWAIAGVRGRLQWTGARPKVEEEVQGAEQTITAPDTGLGGRGLGVGATEG